MNKMLGQNFLVSNKKIANLIPYMDDCIEIGSGTGILTEVLIKKTKKLILVEKDLMLCAILKSKFPSIQLISTDCLKIDISCKNIVTNLPYYISNEFLIKIVFSTKYTNLFIMLQKELAEKIITLKCALGVLLFIHGTLEIKSTFSKNEFQPKPKVDSIFLHIQFKKKVSKNFWVFLQKIFKNSNRKIKNIIPYIDIKDRCNSIKKEQWIDIYNEYFDSI